MRKYKLLLSLAILLVAAKPELVLAQTKEEIAEAAASSAQAKGIVADGYLQSEYDNAVARKAYAACLLSALNSAGLMGADLDTLNGLNTALPYETSLIDYAIFLAAAAYDDYLADFDAGDVAFDDAVKVGMGPNDTRFDYATGFYNFAYSDAESCIGWTDTLANEVDTYLESIITNLEALCSKYSVGGGC